MGKSRKNMRKSRRQTIRNRCRRGGLEQHLPRPKRQKHKKQRVKQDTLKKTARSELTKQKVKQSTLKSLKKSLRYVPLHEVPAMFKQIKSL